MSRAWIAVGTPDERPAGRTGWGTALNAHEAIDGRRVVPRPAPCVEDAIRRLVADEVAKRLSARGGN